MSDFVIEKGIPVPPSLRGKRYPFNEMEIGDSILIPCGGESVNFERFRNRVTAYMSGARKENKELKLVSRKVEGGIRVWRIA